MSPQDDSHLFSEVNALRKPKPDVDQDEIERAKLNTTSCGKIAASKPFEYCTLCVIAFNAGFIGYDADFSARWEKPKQLYSCKMENSNEYFESSDCYQFPIFENFFAIYFTAEVLIRFIAYKRKIDGLKDMWFVFDSTLVLFMVVETWILPIIGASGPLGQLSVLRLLRLLRITRMAKLMRFFPELQIIVKGMMAAVRSVLCTAVLLILILYVFAILFTSEFHQGIATDDELRAEQADSVYDLFGSMGKSMRHLFIMGTILDDITLCTNSIRSSNKGTSMLIFFIIFVLVSSFTMLNMLIGILCEVVCATGEGERNKNTEAHVRESITSLFHKMDKDNNGEISRDEFLSMKRDKNVMGALAELEVRPKHFEMYADLMFQPEKEGGEIPCFNFKETINLIMRLRPGTKVSALDFASFQMNCYKSNDRLNKHIVAIEKATAMLTGVSPPSLAGIPEDVTKKQESSQSQGFQSEEGRINTATLPRLEGSSDQDILAELQRRLGMFARTSEAPIKTGNSKAVDSLAAFQTNLPGLPDMQAWSKETYTC